MAFELARKDNSNLFINLGALPITEMYHESVVKPKQHVFEPGSTISLYTPGVVQPAKFYDGNIVPLA